MRRAESREQEAPHPPLRGTFSPPRGEKALQSRRPGEEPLSSRPSRGGTHISVSCLLLALVLSSCSTSTTVTLPARGDSPYLAIFVTGDGGWRKIDNKVSRILRDAGIPVIGLLSNKYFATEKSPEQAASEVERLMGDANQVILVGYSRGADALPLIVNRLPVATRQRVAAMAMLGPSLKGGLSMKGPDKYPLAPEIARLGTIPLVCVYGTHEKESLCREIPPERATIIAIPGGHHFGGDYDRIGRAILDAVKRNG